LLSCTTVCADAAPETACCRLAPFHHDPGAHRARRYPSDTTDAQWTLIDPLLPDPAWLAGQGGRREIHCRRVIVDAIFYLVDNGIKRRALPTDFPSWSTVYNYFAAWEAAGVTQRVLDGLRDRVRLREGRTAEPSAAIIDSQSVKAAETVGAPSRGYDAGPGTLMFQEPEHGRGVHLGWFAVHDGEEHLEVIADREPTVGPQPGTDEREVGVDLWVAESQLDQHPNRGGYESDTGTTTRTTST
jgi:transposase